jgi:hypothetical protein
LEGFLALVFLFLFSTLSFSQKTITHQELLWMRYFLKYEFSNKYAFKQEVEERVYFKNWSQHQLISRTQVDKKLGLNWSVAAGLTLFRLSLPQDPNSKDKTIQNEIRPQFSFSNQQSLSSKIKLDHRYLTEVRFFENESNKFDYSNIRIRYKAEFHFLLTQQLHLLVFDEILLNAGSNIVQNVFDQNRIGASFLYQTNTPFSFELGYFKWFQQRPSGTEFYSRDIIRFTLHHDFKRKSK